MQSENRMFDDFVKMMNGFAGTFAGMGREAESSAREKFREWMGGQDFVGRDEFEAVKAMAAAALTCARPGADPQTTQELRRFQADPRASGSRQRAYAAAV